MPLNRQGLSTDGQIRPIRTNHPRLRTASSGVPPFIPPSPLRMSATTVEMEEGLPSPIFAQSPTRRTVNINPISIPTEPSTPSPVSPVSPVTPTNDLYAREMPSLRTPSPPPTVTPHLYTWRRIPLAAPTSPLSSHSTGGPLTNPSARMSRARINIAPARVRIQNAAV